MKLIENANILILEHSDIFERIRYNFDVTNLKEFDKYFNFETKEKILKASMVLFIDDRGNTTIIKNRYGKNQI